jgi:hypothetical protein
MPRVKGSDVNKSEEIRQLLKLNPRMKTKAIVAELKSRGIDVHPNQVYIIKTKRRARHRKAAREAAAGEGRRAGISDPVQFVLKIKDLASQAGGIRTFKKLVDALAE